MLHKTLRISIALIVLTFAASSTLVFAQGEADPCAAPVVLTKNCRFQIPTGSAANFGVVYSGWNPFIVSGNVGFDAFYHGNSYDPDDLQNGGREQSIFSRDSKPWVAGVYQQVSASPGSGYFARIGWFVSQNTTIMGRVGIDPSGGTDPNSPNVLWSPSLGLLRQTRIMLRGVRAANSRITVFAEATSNTPFGGGDRLWLTAVALSPDPDVTPATLTPVPPTSTATAPPANTRVPPTRVPQQLAQLASATPTRTATAIPTTPPRITLTATESPAPTETETPLPISTRRPTATPRVGAVADSAEEATRSNLLLLGLAGGATGSAGIGVSLGLLVLWFWKKR